MEFHIENIYTWPAGRCTPRTPCCSNLLLGDLGLQRWWFLVEQLQQPLLGAGAGLPPAVAVYPNFAATADWPINPEQPRRYRQAQQWWAPYLIFGADDERPRSWRRSKVESSMSRATKAKMLLSHMPSFRKSTGDRPQTIINPPEPWEII